MRILLTFLLGIGLAGLFACNSGQDNAMSNNPTSASVAANVYSRMFSELPPFAPPTNEFRQQAKQLGVRGGLLDARDNQPGQNNPDNPNMTEGVHFFGQFLAHDLTLALNAPLLAPTDPRQTTNVRTAKFDLDSLYGGGPEESPELYETTSGDIKFRIDAIPGSEHVSKNGVVRFDLPRDSNHTAIIPDSRDDETVVLSQFHLAMLRFHNAVVDRLRSDPAQANRSARDLFEESRRQVQWHYQWIVLHEYLPLTIGQDRVDEILQNGPRFYRPLDRTQDALFRNAKGDVLIPVEFAVAAYRFGHSQVRPNYRLNFGPDAGPPVILPVFDDAINPNDPDPNDIRGGKRAPRRFIDWQTFFRFDSTNFRFNKKIDTKLSSAVMQLPGARGPAPGLPADDIQSLASRDLMRQVNFGIPSGLAIARLIGSRVLTAAQLAELEPFGMQQSTPLWYYVLKEAEVFENGLRLGPVGSRIVGEVFIGVLQADQDSFLVAQKDFRPTLPSAQAGDFKITDLLRFAGVVHPLN